MVAEEQALLVPERVGDRVPLPLPLPLKQRLGLGEKEAGAEEVPHREAAMLAVGLHETDKVGVKDREPTGL